MFIMNYRTQPSLTAKELAAKQRIEAFGPEPINIFTTLRQELQLSHAQLAVAIPISKHALIRLEQGTFPRPLPSVVDFYVKRHGYNELTLVDNYEHYRNTQRLRYRRLFGGSLGVDSSISDHPLRQLRSQVAINNSELAKSICVPQATLQHFERKWKTQQSVPKELQEALHAIGYTNAEIRSFNVSYFDWRNRMLKSTDQLRVS